VTDDDEHNLRRTARQLDVAAALTAVGGWAEEAHRERYDTAPDPRALEALALAGADYQRTAFPPPGWPDEYGDLARGGMADAWAWLDVLHDPSRGAALARGQLAEPGTTARDWTVAAALLDRQAGDDLAAGGAVRGRLAEALADARRRLGEALADDAGPAAARDLLAEWLRDLGDPVAADLWQDNETKRLDLPLAEGAGAAVALPLPGVPELPGRVWNSWLWRPEALDRADAWLDAPNLTPGQGVTIAHNPRPPAAWKALAGGLWRRLRAELEKERAYDRRRASPSMVAPLVRRVAEFACLRGGKVWVDDDRRVTVSGGRRLAVGPTTDAETARWAAQAGGVLGTMTAQRWVRWAPLVVYEAQRARLTRSRAWSDEDGIVTADADGEGVLVEVRGGWQGLARVVTGTASCKAIGFMQALVDVLWDSQLHDDATGTVRRLLTERPTSTRGSKHSGAGVVRLRLSLWWGAGVVHDYPTRLRRLVPILPVPPLPPGLPRVHAGLAAIDLAATAELAEHADELPTRGGVAIPWERLADDAAVKRAHLHDALNLWQRGPAPRWARTPAGLWRLAETDETQAARDSLEALGEIVQGGREAGQGSVAKRAAARRRSDRKKGGA
jgi:hypothetical protein